MSRKPIASMTLIRGTGACHAYMNGVVMSEFERINRQHDFEMDGALRKLKCIKSQRDELREHDMQDLMAYLYKKHSLGYRIVDKIENAWCVFFGTLMELGIVKYGRKRKKGI